ncbi:MAG TPA: PilZ domain-containing protein [Candidatus Eisenbacteria bacterium]|nr:PilZ domain-containing protein [Candidatus Eisenbacteria bacterium]
MADPSCPKCGKQFVKRVRREGLRERLAGLIAIYPFKCQLCGHRFSAFQWGVRYIRVDDDRRQFERLSINLPGTISVSGKEAPAVIIGLSMNGCTLGLNTAVAPGDVIRIAVQISKDAPPVDIEAGVVRHVGVNSAGIEFVKFAEGERERLRIFVRSLIMRGDKKG